MKNAKILELLDKVQRKEMTLHQLQDIIKKKQKDEDLKNYNQCDYCNKTPHILYLSDKGKQCETCYNNSLTHY